LAGTTPSMMKGFWAEARDGTHVDNVAIITATICMRMGEVMGIAPRLKVERRQFYSGAVFHTNVGAAMHFLARHELIA
jgi:hypothetical protein